MTPGALLIAVVPAVVAVDQVTKVLAARAMHGRPAITLIEGHFKLTYVRNHGAAWSIFSDAPSAVRVPLFIAVSMLAMACILHVYRRLGPGERLLRTGLALILGGALGNFIDRLRNGYVVDFIAWSWHDLHWPRFNVADVAISCGIVVMLWAVVARRRRERPVKVA